MIGFRCTGLHGLQPGAMFASPKLRMRCQAVRRSACRSTGHDEQPQIMIQRRRELLLALSAAAAGFGLVPRGAVALEGLDGVQGAETEIVSVDAPADLAEYGHVLDPTLAYEFDYPLATASGRPLPLIFSRRPERYSSAAPLTADARQRIVCELVNLSDAVTVSLSVGPPAGTLTTTPQDAWVAKQVAEQVLTDRSTARITSGQRVSLNSVEAAEAVTRDGATVYVYEHISQGSPNLLSQSKETYRHALAATAVRPGLDGSPFLFTFTLACPQELWPQLEAPFRRSVESFRLSPPTDQYVAPDQEPWRFF